MRKRINTVLIAAVVSALTVAGLAIAQDDDGGGSGKSDGKAKSGQRPPGPPPGGPMLGGPGGKALTYSETHLRRNGKDVVVRVDKGKVVTASDESIGIERNDGESVTVAVEDDTKVMAGPRKRDAAVGDIATGKQVVVIRDDDAAAEAIAVVPKNPPRGRGGPGHFGPPPGEGMAPPQSGDQG
jgi:hypothetical protein